MEASITLKSIAKKIDKEVVLADLSIGVENNSNHVIIGQNGSGKSSILKILVGIIEKDAGTAYIHGKDISTRSDETRMMTGYMPQYIDLDDEISIYENLLIYSQLFNVSENKAKLRIQNFSEIFDFKKFLFEKSSNLSLGILRSIQFCRALLHDPKILLLDEPTSGMDPQHKIKLWNIIDRIGNDKTILFTTQDFSEAEKYADRISIIHQGDIKMDGSLGTLVNATKGLSKFEIRFKHSVDEEILSIFNDMPTVLKPTINGNSIEFYSNSKNDFFKVLKNVINTEIENIDINFCRLLDLYLGLVENGLE